MRFNPETFRLFVVFFRKTVIVYFNYIVGLGELEIFLSFFKEFFRVFLVVFNNLGFFSSVKKITIFFKTLQYTAGLGKFDIVNFEVLPRKNIPFVIYFRENGQTIFFMLK